MANIKCTISKTIHASYFRRVENTKDPRGGAFAPRASENESGLLEGLLEGFHLAPQKTQMRRVYAV